MRKAIWGAVRDAVFYGAIFYFMWGHVYWLVWACLVGIAVRFLLEDVVTALKRDSEYGAVRQLDAMLERMRATK